MAVLGLKVLMALGVLLLAGTASAQGTKGYYQTLAASPQHKLMVQMVNSNPFYKMMLSTQAIPLTVFAPTDAAFNVAASKYGLSPQAAIKNQALLLAMLRYHVVPGAPMRASTLTKGTRWLKTWYNNLTLKITNGKDSKTGKPITWVNHAAGGVRVVKFDQLVAHPATGRTIGVVHDINGVLMFDKSPAKMLAIR